MTERHRAAQKKKGRASEADINRRGGFETDQASLPDFLRAPLAAVLVLVPFAGAGLSSRAPVARIELSTGESVLRLTLRPELPPGVR